MMTSTKVELAVLFFSLFTCLTALEHFNFRHYLSGSPFRTFSNISITECEFECKSRKKCKTFNYRRHVGYCMLLETDSAMEGVRPVRNPRMAYSEKKDWAEKSIDPLCETCKESEVCGVKNNNVTCATAECGYREQSEVNTQFGNLRQIGSEMVNVCNGRDVVTHEPVTLVIRSECQNGGIWSNSQVTCSADPPSIIEYKGCFKDNKVRVINEKQFNSRYMTISLCAIFCYNRASLYFGVEFGVACFCGPTVHNIGSSSDCNMVCSGDHSKICGGIWAIDVYSFRLDGLNHT